MTCTYVFVLLSVCTLKKMKKNKISRTEIYRLVISELALCKSKSILVTPVFKKVAETTQLSVSKVRCAYYREKKIQFKTHRSHGNQKFSDLDEKEFVFFISTMTDEGLSPSKKIMVDLARSYFNQPNKWDGYRFINRLIKKFKGMLSYGPTKVVRQKRTRATLAKECKTFVDIYKERVEKNHISMKNVFNVDETRIDNTAFTRNNKMIRSFNKTTAGVKDVQALTGVAFVTASGVPFFFVKVLPLGASADRKRTTSTYVRETRNRKNGFLYSAAVWTSTGWLDTERWMLILKKFADLTKLWLAGQPGLLLLDHLKCHKYIAGFKLLHAINIHSMFFAKGSTHISQPLDQIPFAALKLRVKHEGVRLVFAAVLKGEAPTGTLIAIIKKIVNNVFTERVIASSFRVTGLSPINSNLVFTRMARWLASKIKTTIDYDQDHVLRNRVRGALQQTFLCFDTGVKKVKVKIDPKVLYTDDEIIAQAEKQEQEKRNREEQKKARKENQRKRCEEMKKKREEEKKHQKEKIDKLKTQRKATQTELNNIKKMLKRCLFCSSTYNGGKKWRICTKCHIFKICDICSKDCDIDGQIYKWHIQSHKSK